MSKSQALQDFQGIPGVGIRVAEDLWELGYHSSEDLRNQDPQEMYDKLCKLQKTKVDRCMLYVFRCAVYFVNEQNHQPELLKWWRWSDHNLQKQGKMPS